MRMQPVCTAACPVCWDWHPCTGPTGSCRRQRGLQNVVRLVALLLPGLLHSSTLQRKATQAGRDPACLSAYGGGPAFCCAVGTAAKVCSAPRRPPMLPPAGRGLCARTPVRCRQRSASPRVHTWALGGAGEPQRTGAACLLASARHARWHAIWAGPTGPVARGGPEMLASSCLLLLLPCVCLPCPARMAGRCGDDTPAPFSTLALCRPYLRLQACLPTTPCFVAPACSFLPPLPQGFADDYAYVIAGLLDLYSATGEVQHLQVCVVAGSLRRRHEPRPCLPTHLVLGRGASLPRPCCVAATWIRG